MVEIRFVLPREWRDELQGAARVRAISLADLMRIICRGFLRERYTDDEQAALR